MSDPTNPRADDVKEPEESWRGGVVVDRRLAEPNPVLLRRR